MNGWFSDVTITDFSDSKRIENPWRDLLASYTIHSVRQISRRCYTDIHPNRKRNILLHNDNTYLKCLKPIWKTWPSGIREVNIFWFRYSYVFRCWEALVSFQLPKGVSDLHQSYPSAAARIENEGQPMMGSSGTARRSLQAIHYLPSRTNKETVSPPLAPRKVFRQVSFFQVVLRKKCGKFHFLAATLT